MKIVAARRASLRFEIHEDRERVTKRKREPAARSPAFIVTPITEIARHEAQHANLMQINPGEERQITNALS